MHRNAIIVSGCLLLLGQLHGAEMRGCIASAPLGSFRLSVQRPKEREARPIRGMNIQEPGERLAYEPVTLPPDLRKSARVSLVLAPSDSTGSLSVFEPRPAREKAVWTVPFRVSAVAVVFGPQGLNRKKVASLVKKDRELIMQLASYAEQTAQMENLIQALSEGERNNSLDAALSGFAARGLAPGLKLDRSAPMDQQALTLFRGLAPALATYDPLAPQAATRMQQSAGLAASIAAMFFGTNVGIAAGGAAMVQNLRTLLFPGADFRSALAQPADDGVLTLCAKPQTTKSRTRIAYLWAHRLPDSGPPAIAISGSAHLPLGLKSAVAAEISSGGWSLAARAHDWELVSDPGGQSYPVRVSAGQDKQLEIDLSGARVPPGAYRLAAKWDWDSFATAGILHVHPLGDFSRAALAPGSQDELVEGAGQGLIKLTGADFEFVDKVMLNGETLAFALPAGKRAGPQNTMEIAVNTRALKAGAYQLALFQGEAATGRIAIRVLPPNPAIENLPVLANLGEARQRLVLRGTGLERIEKIESPDAEFELGKAERGSRPVFVSLGPGAAEGKRIALSLRVEGLTRPVAVPDAIEVVGPRPRVRAVSVSLPENLGIELRKGELPAGSFAGFSIQVENGGAQPAMRLECGEADGDLEPEILRPGERKDGAQLESAGGGLLFLSLDPGSIGRPGRRLNGAIVTRPEGASDPFELGRVVRLPHIESFSLTNEKVGESAYAGLLTGQDLEMIEKVGWDAKSGVAVTALPRPVAGRGHQQTLTVALPWPAPAPHAPVYIWLRGETEGRATRARF
jgi:hypothetical protein